MRRSTRTVHTTMRLQEDVLKALKRYAEGQRRTPGAVITMALKEWVDMQRFPGIDYRWTATGREPHVTGTGLTIREMWWIWTGLKRRWARIRYYYPHLKESQVRAAVAYGKAYPETTTLDEAPPWFTVVKV
jgi:predicted transcriptional regulator